MLEVVPSYLDAMLDVWQEEDSWPEFSGLRWLMVTGEACHPMQVNRWLRHYPSIPVVNTYGPTDWRSPSPTTTICSPQATLTI